MASKLEQARDATFTKLQPYTQEVEKKFKDYASKVADLTINKPVKGLAPIGRDVQKAGKSLEQAGQTISGYGDPFEAAYQTFRHPVESFKRDPTFMKRAGSAASFLVGDNLQEIGAAEQAVARGGIAEPFKSLGYVGGQVKGGNFDVLNSQKGYEAFGALGMLPFIGYADDISDLAKLSAKGAAKGSADDVAQVVGKNIDDINEPIFKILKRNMNVDNVVRNSDDSYTVIGDKVKMSFKEHPDMIEIPGFYRGEAGAKGEPTKILGEIKKYADEVGKDITATSITGGDINYWKKAGFDTITIDPKLEKYEAIWSPAAEQVGKQADDLLSEANKITSLNPTGSVFVDYTPKARLDAELGNNMTTVAKTLKKNPDTMITVYRGVPEGVDKINAGDFVTTDIDYAKSWGTNVVSKKVKLGDLLDDIEEPSKGFDSIYRPNASKELESRVYDYTKSDWYKNYTEYLIKNKDKFPTPESWIESMKASSKTKAQLTDIWNQANKLKGN